MQVERINFTNSVTLWWLKSLCGVFIISLNPFFPKHAKNGPYGLQCTVVVVLIKAMFTLCGIALVPVEFINISHTTYNIGFLFTHTNSWPLCHSLPGTVWTGIRTIVEVKKVWSRIGTYWDGSKKNRSGDLYLFHQTVLANHSSKTECVWATCSISGSSCSCYTTNKVCGTVYIWND